MSLYETRNCGHSEIVGMSKCYTCAGDQSRKEREMIKSALLGMIEQHCSDIRFDKETNARTFHGYDSGYIRANETALEVAVVMGWINRQMVLR